LPCAAAAQPPAAPELVERYDGREVWDPVWQWKNVSTLDRPVWYWYDMAAQYVSNGWHSVTVGPFDNVHVVTPYSDVVAPPPATVGGFVSFRLIAKNVFGDSPMVMDWATIGPPPPLDPPQLVAPYQGKTVSTTATPAWSWTGWTKWPRREGIQVSGNPQFYEIRLTGPGGPIETRQEAAGFVPNIPLLNVFKPSAPLPNGPYQWEVRSLFNFRWSDVTIPTLPVYSEWVKDTVVIDHPLEAPRFVNPFHGDAAGTTPTWSWEPAPTSVKPEHYVVRKGWKDPKDKDREETVYATFWQPKEPLPEGLNGIGLRAVYGTEESPEVEDQVNVVLPPQKVTLQFAEPAGAVFERDENVQAPLKIVTDDGRPTRAKVRASCRFEGATATAGRDFDATEIQVEVSASTPSGSSIGCPVHLLQDLDREPAERLTVSLAAPEGAELGNPVRYELMVVEGDVQAIVLVPEPSGETSLQVQEGQSTEVDLKLASRPQTAISLALASSDPRVGTVEPAGLSYDPAQWDRGEPLSFRVSAVGDRWAVEGDAPFTVTVEPSGAAGEPLPAPRILRFLRQDAPGISFSPASVQADEPDGVGRFTVRLASRPAHEVSVPLEAEPPGKVALSSTELIFTPDGPLEQEVTVTAVDDPDMDSQETFRVRLDPATSQDGGYSGRKPEGTGYVEVLSASDDVQSIVFDPEPAGEIPLLEGEKNYKIRFGLAKRPVVPIPVAFTFGSGEKTELSGEKTFEPEKWAAGDWVEFDVGAAANEVDEEDVPMQLQVKVEDGVKLPAGQIPPSRTIPLSRIDTDAAGVRVSPPLGLLVPADGTAGTVKVSLTSRPTEPVAVPLWAYDLERGWNHLGVFTFDERNWKTGQDVAVPGTTQRILADPLQSNDTFYRLWPAGVAVATPAAEPGVAVFPAGGLITSEAGGSAVFAVALGTRPVSPVTVPLSVPSGEASVSPTSLTFTPDDWARVREVTVTGQDDGVADGPARYTVVTGRVESGDPAYAGSDPPDVQAMSVAGDEAGIVVFPASTETLEGQPALAQLSVVLSRQPSRDVVVSLNPSEREGRTFPSRLVFTPRTWSLPQTVSVEGADELVDDGDRTWRLRLSPAASLDPVYAALPPVEVELTNRDNDTAGLVEYPSTLAVTESGKTAMLSLGLRSQPTTPVILRLTSSDPEEVQVIPDSVVFADHPFSASTAQFVTVTGRDDPEDDGDATATIHVRVESADPLYDGMAAHDVTVTVEDDDEAGIEVQPTEGLTTLQTGGEDRFRVRLKSRPTAPVTIPVSLSRPEEALLSTDSLTFTPADWDSFQEVLVTGRFHLAGDPPTAHTIVLGPADSTDKKYDGLDAPDVRALSLDAFAFDITPLSGLTTTESGGVARFNVAIPWQPQADLHIPLAVDDPAEGTVTPQELVFTPRDWDVPRTVQVAGVDDDEVDGPKTYSVTLGPIRTDEPGMDGWELPSVELVNLDDDHPEEELGGNFYTVTPCRVLDSRQEGGALVSGEVRPVPVRGRCGIPDAAKAVALNVTAVQPTAAGWLTLAPGGQVPPDTIVVGFPPEVNRAAGTVLGLSRDGGLAARASAQVHLIVDVVGWFD
jgi:hypothetical protein